MNYIISHLFFRHGITVKEVSGESEKVTKEMTVPWEDKNLTNNITLFVLINAGQIIVGLMFAGLMFANFL